MSMTDNMSREDALAILGLKPGASQTDIKTAYKAVVKQVHSDVGGTDFLFRLVHQAYEMLMQPSSRPSRPESHSEPEPEPQKERRMTWNEVVRQDNFYVDFDQLSKVLLYHETITVRYQDYNVTIRPVDAELNLIKSTFPLTISVKTWNNPIARLLRLRPRQSAGKTIRVSNEPSRLTYFASSKFEALTHVLVDKGWHEITLEYLDAKQVIRTRTKSVYDNQKFRKSVVLKGDRDIRADITVRVTGGRT